VLKKFKQMPHVLGRRGLRWLGVAILASLSLAALEYGIAGFLQLFLVSLGYVDPKMIPKWLAGMDHLPVEALSLLLVGIGVFRAASLFMAS